MCREAWSLLGRPSSAHSLGRPRRGAEQRKDSGNHHGEEHPREAKGEWDAWLPKADSHTDTHSYVSQVISVQSKGGVKWGGGAGRRVVGNGQTAATPLWRSIRRGRPMFRAREGLPHQQQGGNSHSGQSRQRPGTVPPQGLLWTLFYTQVDIT